MQTPYFTIKLAPRIYIYFIYCVVPSRIELEPLVLQTSALPTELKNRANREHQRPYWYSISSQSCPNN
jgi:hypothetical protein